ENEFSDFALSGREWEVLHDFQLILEAPSTVQQLLSGQATPTLSLAVPAMEVFLTGWERLVAQRPHYRRFLDSALEIGRQYYTRMDDTDAYVMSMFVNPSIKMAWIEKNWDRSYIRKA
ncbi:hypothetical protein BV25DRAFT_1772038, partial [Artomyces pyxidatus]